MFGLFKKGPRYVTGTGTYIFEIVGESNYQEQLARICSGKTRDSHHHFCQAVLSPEPSNMHDKNAVRVSIEGATVGYLPRATTKKFHQTYATAIVVDAIIVGGWDRGNGDSGHFGVRLDYP